MKKANITLSILLILSMLLAGCGNAAVPAKTPEEITVQSVFSEDYVTAADLLTREGYTLEKVVILSRHNMRAPLSDEGSLLGRITPHKWVSWTANAKELSLRGGMLETEFGQFFRIWLEKEGLFPENYRPEDGSVRIYANSKQRTIATANYFLSGLLPVSDLEAEHHGEYDSMDPVFNPVLSGVNDEFRAEAEKEINELFGEDLNAIGDKYELISDLIDLKDSEAYKSGEFTGFAVGDSVFSFEDGKEPAVVGSLSIACNVTDALVLQLYEGPEEESVFGKSVSKEDWQNIGEIKDLYEDVLFNTPVIARNVARPLAAELLKELEDPERKFSILIGHDSNQVSLLSALGSEDFYPVYAIEKTPIGGKLVFSLWKDAEGKEYMGVDLVYLTVDQLRDLEVLDLDNSPASISISFKGIKANEDGLYRAEDIINRFKEAVE